MCIYIYMYVYIILLWVLSSSFLFSILSSLMKLIIHKFSVKHNLHKSGLWLPYTFLVNVHLTEKLFKICIVIPVTFFKIKFFSIIWVLNHVCSIYNWRSLALTTTFQLHPNECYFDDKMLRLWEDMIEIMLVRQL